MKRNRNMLSLLFSRQVMPVLYSVVTRQTSKLFIEWEKKEETRKPSLYMMPRSMICGNKIALASHPRPLHLHACVFCRIRFKHGLAERLIPTLDRIPEQTGWSGVKGNFDVVIENDDLDRAVGELSGCLREWFPKIDPAEPLVGSDGDGGDEKKR